MMVWWAFIVLYTPKLLKLLLVGVGLGFTAVGYVMSLYLAKYASEHVRVDVYAYQLVTVVLVVLGVGIVSGYLLRSERGRYERVK